jgi:hypothetical protein
MQQPRKPTPDGNLAMQGEMASVGPKRERRADRFGLPDAATWVGRSRSPAGRATLLSVFFAMRVSPVRLPPIPGASGALHQSERYVAMTGSAMAKRAARLIDWAMSACRRCCWSPLSAQPP